MIPRAAEAAVVGVGGAAIAGAIGSMMGLAGPAALVGGCNGVISGWRRTYDWQCSSGVIAAVSDSSWALLTTAGALGAHAIAAVTRGGYLPELSERQNRHVYRRGFTPRRGFAVTIGNTVSGAGDPADERRRHLVNDHEQVHINQTRLLGPAFPVLYVGWMILAAPLGAIGWAKARASGDRSSTLWASVDRCAYWQHPLERQAYLRASRASQAARG